MTIRHNFDISDICTYSGTLHTKLTNLAAEAGR